jgi:hypothetical protein
MAVTVKLIGGLGNQLFGYFAALYAARKSGDSIVLDLSRQQANPHPSSSILDFGVQGKVRFSNPLGELKSRLVTSAPPIIPKLNYILAKTLRVHAPQEIGFDLELGTKSKNLTLLGYFQTYRYFLADALSPGDRRLELVYESDWFKSMKERALEVKPVMVHVRRGDYSNPENNYIGTLDKEYYLDGVRLIMPEGSGRQVWVFSDSVDQVRKEFGVEGWGFEYILTPRSVSAAEVMTLMSMSAGLVISNSTFSYWAAMLGDDPRVVAPSKWFRKGSDPLDLLPPEWNRVESRWSSWNLD